MSCFFLLFFSRLCRLGIALLHTAPVLPGGGGAEGSDAGAGKEKKCTFPTKLCVNKSKFKFSPAVRLRVRHRPHGGHAGGAGLGRFRRGDRAQEGLPDG